MMKALKLEDTYPESRLFLTVVTVTSYFGDYGYVKTFHTFYAFSYCVNNVLWTMYNDTVKLIESQHVRYYSGMI